MHTPLERVLVGVIIVLVLIGAYAAYTYAGGDKKPEDDTTGDKKTDSMASAAASPAALCQSGGWTTDTEKNAEFFCRNLYAGDPTEAGKCVSAAKAVINAGKSSYMGGAKTVRELGTRVTAAVNAVTALNPQKLANNLQKVPCLKDEGVTCYSSAADRQWVGQMGGSLSRGVNWATVVANSLPQCAAEPKPNDLARLLNGPVPDAPIVEWRRDTRSDDEPYKRSPVRPMTEGMYGREITTRAVPSSIKVGYTPPGTRGPTAMRNYTNSAARRSATSI